MEDVLTVFKASQLCNVSAKTIINWIESGHIKAYKTVGGHRRINRSDLKSFMKKQGIPIPAQETDGLNDYEVISASDGFEAGLQINHFAPNLLILDIMMPDIKGYEVCKKIKDNPDTANTKIIVLSAYLDEDKFKKMKQYGADACFSKPFPLPQLKEEVARLLELR
jgi:excisionase family DNA binding protein